MGPVNLKIEQLLLDSENPRLVGEKSQRDLLQKILDDQGQKLFELAQDIVTEGLSPIDRLLVLREKKGKKLFVVLEGNRRLAAIKLLDNPHLLPSLTLKSSLQKRFESLSKSFNKQAIEPISCFEVVDRAEGAKWIFLRHTGENDGRGVVGWTGLATRRFRGTDPALQALDFVKQHGNLTAEQQHTIETNFPITTLDRLLSTREVRDLTGVKISDRKLRSGLPPTELLKPLKRMVLDLAHRKVNVSDLKNKTQQIAYINKFASSDMPDRSIVGAIRAIDEIHGDEFKSKTSKQRTARGPSLNLSDRKTLVPPRERLNIKDSKVEGIFKELKSLPIEKYPHAASVLLRVFLELSVDYYMETHKIPLFAMIQQNKVNKKLQSKIAEVVDHLVTIQGCNRRDFAGVVRSVSVSHSPLSIDLLHGYLHSRFIVPKTRDLIGAWDEAQPFFKRIWF